MLDNVRADLLRECRPAARWQDVRWSWRDVVPIVLDRPGAWAVLEYRFRRWIAARSRSVRLAAKPVTFVTRHVIESVTGISIHSSANIGPGLYIGHFGGIFVGRDVRAGENLTLSQNVTVGEHRGSPTLGSQVYLGPGAKVFGSVTIGDHVAVGANAVVHRDVPAFSTVVAAPVQILPDRGNMRGRRATALIDRGVHDVD